LVVWGPAHYPELPLLSAYSQQKHKGPTFSWYFCAYRTQHYWAWQKMVPIFHFISQFTNARITTCTWYYETQVALRLVWMMNTVLWDVMSYGLVEVHQHLRRTHWSKFLQTTSCWLLDSHTLLLWHRCSTFLQNTGELPGYSITSQKTSTLHGHRRQNRKSNRNWMSLEICSSYHSQQNLYLLYTI
jgi:hypothetical protein